jgi:hypothetical protein
MTSTQRTRWTVCLLLVATAVGLGCGSTSSPSTGSGDPAVTTTTAKPKPAGNTITDEGQLLVGSEVKPGTYRATVPADSVGCYYARLKALDGELASVITNGIGEAGKKVTVTIKASDKAFETNGCGTWTKIS